MSKNKIVMFAVKANGTIGRMLGSDGTRYVDNRLGINKLYDMALKLTKDLDKLGKEPCGFIIVHKSGMKIGYGQVNYKDL